MIAELLFKLGFISLVLSVITIIDLKTRKIPDIATIGLAAGGFVSAYSENGWSASIGSVLVSGAVYFSFFWAVRKLHSLMTGRIGLGFGDVKLAGAMGMWLPIGFLPIFVTGAAISALLAFTVLYLSSAFDILKYKIPFAPFMCLSFMGVWILSVSFAGLDFLNEFAYIQ